MSCVVMTSYISGSTDPIFIKIWHKLDPDMAISKMQKHVFGITRLMSFFIVATDMYVCCFADKTAVLIHYGKLKWVSKMVILGTSNFHSSEIKISSELKTQWKSEHTWLYQKM